MKPTLFLLLITFPILLNAQVTVKGVVTEQNSGNKPLAGVQIKALGTTPEQTGNDGLFQLTFASKKPGDHIIVSEISKKGYEVVNKDMVNNWVISSNSTGKTKIVMCPEGLIAQNTLKYYEISMAGLTRGYQERIKALQEQKAKAEIDARSYGEQAGILANQFARQQEQLEELAGKFARENFDDCSAVHRLAFEAFTTGNIGEALRILESVNSGEEIEKAKQQRKKAEILKTDINEMLIQSDSIIRKNIKKLMFQADLYQSEFRFAEAEQAYVTAVMADTTDFENIIALAKFCQVQNKYNELLRWANTMHAIAKTAVDTFWALDKTSHWQVKMKQPENALANWIEAIKTLRRLVAENPQAVTHRTKLAVTLYHSALIYDYLNEYPMAESYFRESISILRSLDEEYPDYYDDMLAVSLYGLGTHFYQVKEYDKSEEFLKEALTLFRNEPPGKDSLTNRIWTSRIISELGYLSFLRDHYPEAEAFFIESLATARECAMQNPDAYNASVYGVLLKLSTLQCTMGLYSKSEASFMEMLQVTKRLAELNPCGYNSKLAEVLYLIGHLYIKMNSPEKATPYFSESVNLARESAETFGGEDQLNAAEILHKTAWEIHKYDLPQAIAYTDEAIRIFEQSAGSRLLDNDDVSLCYGQMARYQLLSKNFTDAEKYARLDVACDFNAKASNKNLAHSLLFQGKYKEAKKYYLDIRDETCDWDKTKTLGDVILDDFAEFEKAGITHPDVEKIRKELTE